ncbi:universal stress protein [Haloarculaceae archaeon H-GB2-1]|nr:universal stress protein [Haloarculaceae archaeon H-GB1-1]MEA5387360.1 universal stress protein [Haloarculaceae archaeon H-GB11]MEA5408829.1 universal stress protein [Haloarculaceae archaeon H-GB2-1]
MYDTILIPVDGSDESKKAVDHGIELAKAFDSTIHALYVINVPGTPRTPYIRDDEEEIRKAGRDFGEQVTGEVVRLAGEAGVDAVSAIRTGTVHEDIVEYADEEGMDTIVMGTGYRGKMGALLGSITEKVVRTAEVPVTTIRMGIDD